MVARVAFAALACLVLIVLLAICALQVSGADMSELWADIAVSVFVLAGATTVLVGAGGATALRRVRNRRRRPLARYQLVLSQADEATFEEVAAAYEQLVQAVRRSVSERFLRGQPWLAIESWYVPPQRPGETGTAALMLACQPSIRGSAMAALRRAYPDLSLRTDPVAGRPLEFGQPRFEPGHVLRVRKARGWALPLGTGRRGEAFDARSTIAGVVRQQQQAARVSCVRWCLLPAPDHLDSRAADKLRGGVNERPDAARSGDVQAALQSAGGAMTYLELQAAVEERTVTGRRGRVRPETFSEMQGACRQLLSPALSHRGTNHLCERMMVSRQGLYQRRWSSGEPPLLPQLGGCTLIAPRELALLMELPSLGSEHALPLQRNTIPNLPVPTEVPRARHVELELPGAHLQASEIIDAEPIL